MQPEYPDRLDKLEAKLDQILEAVNLILLCEVIYEPEDDGFPSDLPFSS